MGIGGHILGPRKLRQISRDVGIDFDRAFNRNGYCVGRRLNEEGQCEHYEVDLVARTATLILDPMHWTSCRDREREGQ